MAVTASPGKSMTLRPEVQWAIVSTTFILGVMVGGAAADEGTTGWPKVAMGLITILAIFVWFAALVACAIDLFWARGFTT